MKEPKDMVLPMLKEMRAEIAAFRARVEIRFDENDKAHTTFRHALAGDSLLGRPLTGEFEERIEKLGSNGWRATSAHLGAARD